MLVDTSTLSASFVSLTDHDRSVNQYVVWICLPGYSQLYKRHIAGTEQNVKTTRFCSIAPPQETAEERLKESLRLRAEERALLEAQWCIQSDYWKVENRHYFLLVWMDW